MTLRDTPSGPLGADRTFQVDLRGLVDLLSHHLYSSPRVYLRELLQNAVDALTARRQLPRPGRPPHPQAWGSACTPTAGWSASRTTAWV